MFVRFLAAAITISVLSMAGPRALAAPHRADDPAMAQAKSAVARGLAYLHRTQAKDGSWDEYPAVTALALTALLRNGKTEQNDPAVAKGIKFLLGFQKPNGAICIEGNPSTALPNYNTGLCLMALALTRNPAYRPVIAKAQQYLARSQFDESQGIRPSNPMYGGIGYGDDPGDETHPDLSNLQTALEGLHDSGMPSGSPVFRKALIYLKRVQNRRESNDLAWVRSGPNDGGFLYESHGGTKTPAGRHTSYGSMTFAGIKSSLYCGVAWMDPRVQAAWYWLRAHYTVKEHPGMGSTSLYYYYLTMATTLRTAGQKVVTDLRGQRHDWAHDLAAQLVARQRPDGSWVNSNARYWENRPSLVTSYGLISLAFCLENGRS